MAIYDADEEQQIEAIKDWFKENGKSIALGLVIGLGGILGWRYYQGHQLETLTVASQGYTEVVAKLDAKGLDEENTAQDYIDANIDNTYSVFTAMKLAKLEVDAKNLDKALTQLKWAETNNKDKTLATMITYHTARVLSGLGKYDEAIAKLETIKDDFWVARQQELLGDIYVLKDDRTAAKNAYNQALQAQLTQEGQPDQQAQMNSQVLQIKLDDLA